MVAPETHPRWQRAAALLLLLLALLALAWHLHRRTADGTSAWQLVGAASAPHSRADLEREPVKTGSIVFVGDSLTAQGHWGSFATSTTPVLNHGISGDTSEDVLARIHLVARHEPRAVFLMIGINDLSRGRRPAEIVATQARIVAMLRVLSPGTKIHVQSVLPAVDLFADEVATVNRQLALFADDDVQWVDLHPAMVNERGLLRPELATDNVHLNERGYEAWRTRIAPLVK